VLDHTRAENDIERRVRKCRLENIVEAKITRYLQRGEKLTGRFDPALRVIEPARFRAKNPLNPR
jgi:hypothetical protein